MVGNSSDQFDPDLMAGRSGKPFVACDQDSIEGLGKRDVSGVIGGQVVPQRPNARQKETMAISPQRKVGQVEQGRAAAFAADIASRGIPADHLRDLDVEQMRRVKCLIRNKQACFD